MADEGPTARLQVANARPEDAGRGVARVSQKVLAELGLAEGQAIEIIGKRHTTALALTPYAEDEGLNIIRLDGLQRVNAGIGSGDYVEIRKAEVRSATRSSSRLLRRTFVSRAPAKPCVVRSIDARSRPAT